MMLDGLLGELRDYSLLITDARQDDNPIVFANDTFLRLTGYKQNEVLGRNCRFLQGPDTDLQTVRILSEAIRLGESVVVDILNYKSDTTPFWNRLQLRPLRGDDDRIAHYLGLQVPIDL